MRVLFITTQLPYPPKSGGVIKTFRLLEYLKSRYEVSLVHLLKGDDKAHIAAFRELSGLVEHIAIPIDRPRTAMNLLKSYVSAPTLNVYRNAAPDFQRAVDRLFKEADILIVDHYEMGQYIPKSSDIKVILHEHNAEFIMWQRLAEIEKNPLKKLVLTLEAARIRKTEKAYAERADLIWAAPNDIEELASIDVRKEKMAVTYHLGEDEMLQEPDIVWGETTQRLLFIGTLTWEANVHGLLWFFEHCWAKLKARNPECVLDIIGKNPDVRLLDMAKGLEGIRFLGFVDNLEPHYASSRVFIVPLKFGSGIKVKLLNAMYRGIPTVTTSIGMEGLKVSDGFEMFIKDDADGFVAAVSKLLSEEEVWQEQKSNMRETAQSYTWKNLLAEHENQMIKLL